MMMKYVSTICTTIVKWVHKVYNSDEMSFNNTHTNVQQFRSTSSVTSDLWEMGFNNVPNNYQSVLNDVQHNDQTTRSTSSVTSDLWKIGLDNVQCNDRIVKHKV